MGIKKSVTARKVLCLFELAGLVLSQPVLDPQDLRSARLVQRLWNHLIVSSDHLNIKWRLQVSPEASPPDRSYSFDFWLRIVRAPDKVELYPRRSHEQEHVEPPGLSWQQEFRAFSADESSHEEELWRWVQHARVVLSDDTTPVKAKITSAYYTWCRVLFFNTGSTRSTWNALAAMDLTWDTKYRLYGRLPPKFLAVVGLLQPEGKAIASRHDVEKIKKHCAESGIWYVEVVDDGNEISRLWGDLVALYIREFALLEMRPANVSRRARLAVAKAKHEIYVRARQGLSKLTVR